MNNKYINIEYKNKYHKYKNKYHNLCNKTKLKGGHAGLTVIGSIIFILIAIYFGYEYLPSNLKFREDVQKQIQDIQRVPIKKTVYDESDDTIDNMKSISYFTSNKSEGKGAEDDQQNTADTTAASDTADDAGGASAAVSEAAAEEEAAPTDNTLDSASAAANKLAAPESSVTKDGDGEADKKTGYLKSPALPVATDTDAILLMILLAEVAAEERLWGERVVDVPAQARDEGEGETPLEEVETTRDTNAAGDVQENPSSTSYCAVM